MTRPFPVTRFVFAALVLVVRGLWALPWWLMLVGALVTVLLVNG